MQNEIAQYTFSREKADFEKLYRNYAPYALRVAVLICKNPQLAADIVQETFVRVYLNLPKLIGRNPLNRVL